MSYYDDVDALCDELRGRGANDWSDRVQNAVRSGATSSEIIQEVNIVLREFLSSGAADGLSLRPRVEALVDAGHAIWEGRAR